jgi:hypothetical protein
MSKIPKRGATPLYFVVEESRGQAWRPIGWSTLDQRAALTELDRLTSSYTLRVVQVVAVRLPPETPAELRAQGAEGRWIPGEPPSEPDPPACAVTGCEAPALPGARYCSGHAGLDVELVEELDAREYGPDRYDEDFPRPRSVERCADCGAEGERTGHQACQFPEDHP